MARDLCRLDRPLTVLQFQLRYCPALAKKPKQNEKPNPDTEKKPDPFVDPPGDLFIANVSNAGLISHIVVLNKYPVIAEHFILATKDDKPQTGLLEQDDLQAAYICLTEWERHGDGKRLFAFFNSGEHSGASQPHRHLQFLPVESMRAGDDDGSWELLTDTVASRPDLSLPFVRFSKTLPSSPTAQQLHDAYMNLLDQAVAAIGSYDAQHSVDGSAIPSGNSGAVAISYNLAMTTSAMVIVPRRSEGTVLHDASGTEVGSVALNGTILGGTLMVKLRGEWEVLRGSSEVLDGVLHAIGIPPRHDATARPYNAGKI